MMKKIVFACILSYAFIVCFSQTDSLYRNDLIKKVNDYRKSKSLKSIQISNNLNRATEAVLKKGSLLKDKQGNYNKDSIRNILRENGNYDYQFDIIETTTSKNKRLMTNNTLSEDLQKTISNSEYNNMGLSLSESNELSIITKHIIDFDSTAHLKIYAPDFNNFKNLKTIVVLTGNSESDSIYYNWFENSKNVEVDTPIIKKPLIINGKKFEIEIDVSETNEKKPKKLTFVDKKNKIISQYNLR